jgi:hypothetical protein
MRSGLGDLTAPEMGGDCGSSLSVNREYAGFRPVLMVELGNEDLDLLAANAVGVHERLRYPGHQPALGIDITRRLLDGHDRHGALLSTG